MTSSKSWSRLATSGRGDDVRGARVASKWEPKGFLPVARLRRLLNADPQLSNVGGETHSPSNSTVRRTVSSGPRGGRIDAGVVESRGRDVPGVAHTHRHRTCVPASVGTSSGLLSVALTSTEVVLEAHDIVLAEIGAGLNLDELNVRRAVVFTAMRLPDLDGDVLAGR